MARNVIKSGVYVDIVAPSAVTSGDFVVAGDLFGVAMDTAAAGETVALCTLGEAVLPKASGQALALGAVAYWDGTNKRVTSTATGNKRIGVVTRAAAASDATVTVRVCCT